MNRQKILIVDDSELNREMLKAILGEEYDYAEAEDGAQAILMLQQDMNIDLLLLDINMPKIDGFGVLERLNQFRWIEELPVIMISATEDRAVIERCYLALPTISAVRSTPSSCSAASKTRSRSTPTRSG